MSTIFKSNGRFDILNEDNTNDNDRKNNDRKNNDRNNKNRHDRNTPVNHDEKQSINYFKSDGGFKEQHKSYQRRPLDSKYKKEQEEKFKKQQEIREQREREEALKESNFPDLIQKPSIVNAKQEHDSPTKEPVLSFADKAKNALLNANIKPIEDLDAVKPGWVSMTKDKNSNKIIYKYGKSTYVEKEPKPVDVLNALVEVYERRILQYDSLWGEGAYEERFQPSKYRSTYYDLLDEQYEDEIEQLEEEYETDGYEY